jgi:hydroxyethylthiazole kinase
MNETANAILCLGALPIMAHAKEEVAEMVGIANALVLNIGTLEPEWVDAMEIAGRRANELGIPVILDPVGAGTTRLRIDSSRRLLEKVKVSIVRGNAAEVSILAGLSAEIRGVESISSEMTAEAAVTFAKTIGCTVAITGAVDVVSDGTRCARIANGHVMMSKVVGTGCISNVIVASFAAVQPDAFLAGVEGLTAFGIAGEMAAEAAPEKPGSFHVEMYNALYALDDAAIRARARVDIA